MKSAIFQKTSARRASDFARAMRSRGVGAGAGEPVGGKVVKGMRELFIGQRDYRLMRLAGNNASKRRAETSCRGFPRRRPWRSRPAAADVAWQACPGEAKAPPIPRAFPIRA